jgi:sterol desaturase/sphingolipid hydroxylase (fatty acid hydroxylase superfamily)
MLTRNLPILLYSMPAVALLMLAEAYIMRRFAARNPGLAVDVPGQGRPLRGYQLGDTIVNVITAILSTVPGIAINAASVVIGLAAWDHRLFSLGTGWVAWLVAIVVVDFSEYWNHRAGHRVRLLWANHVQHHSSKYLNVSTALRTPLTSFSNIVFFPWLAIFGLQPWIVFAAFSINAVYQMMVHTEVVGKLPPVIEYVFTTPSHHRVHHGKDGQYIDKNFGSVFIVWDRMFGTFQPEEAPVTYGLVHDIDTNNLWTIFSHEYVAMIRDMRRFKGLRNKLALFVMPPGWKPSVATVNAG